jgi:hypothetical protein
MASIDAPTLKDLCQTAKVTAADQLHLITSPLHEATASDIVLHQVAQPY